MRLPVSFFVTGLAMNDDARREARNLAYRWFRRKRPEATHQEAWAFAGVNWERFLSEVRPRRPAQQTVGQ